MGTLLRVLVIVITVLTAASLYFANANFQKRQILLGRNAAFEETVKAVAKTLEATDAQDVAATDLPKDISEVADRVLNNPEMENVLDGYPLKLESANLPTLDFTTDEKRLQLRSFYALQDDGKYRLDPVENKPAITGPGTQRELLDTMEARAKAQQATLNKTRAELAKMRDRAAGFVGEINKLKSDSRVVKKELTETKEVVVELKDDKAKLESSVAKLTTEKRELQAEVADATAEAERLREDKVSLMDDLAKLNTLNQELLEKIKGIAPGSDKPTMARDVAMSTGTKGKIIESNDEFKFAIIEFTADAMVEMMGADREEKLPALEMIVRRTGRKSAAGEFVTRVKLRQPVPGKNLVVADILSDWQQVPVERGDVVYF